MSSAKRYHQKKPKLKANKRKPKEHTKSSLIIAQQHHMAGRLSQAKIVYNEILQAEPNNPDALHLLGVINHQGGNIDNAVDLILKALEAYPNFPEALNNLGNAYIDLDRFQEAVDSYNLALGIKPDYQIAQNNLCKAFYELGNYLHKLGKHEAATENYINALAIKPDYAKASYNLGVALSAQGKMEEAEKSYIKSLSSDPSHAESHSNLGNVLFKLERYDDAVESYLKALSIKPDFAEAHFNLGGAYREIGMLKKAKASYHNALAIRPDYVEVWQNLKYVTKALQSQGEDDLTNLSDYARASSDFAFQQFYLDGFRPHQADDSLKRAIATLPAKSDQTIPINTLENLQSNTTQLTEQVVALLHFGRSGTGLLHSLVDNHPEISTLPSIYLSGYFNKGVWDRISIDGWKGIPRHFADEFAVLFDSRNPKPVPSRLGEDHSKIGEKEGMTALGKNRNEYLSVDTEGFCNAATNIMEGMENINPMSFLLVAHAAFEEVTRRNEEQVTNKHLCFYHIHNPDHYAQANFLRYATDTRILMIVREPVENCQSWIRSFIDKNNYEQCVFRILTLLFDIDQVFFRMTGSVGVRLEDLKYRHEDTLKALCNWLGIKVCPTLYEMTAQGKKWWGDPSSPHYSEDKAMSAFSDTTTQQTTSSTLSDSDQFILRTLFNPFSVRFGYLKSNKGNFESDLKEIKPLIGGMMDFEKAMLEQLNLNPDQFRKREAYKIFHAGLLERWQVLDEFGDYPHMLEPLIVE
jgi:tetratricopeptide (TPR) repeat protein